MILFTPTPLHPLPALSEHLGLELWIKRDDLTGLAGGGNKARKLVELVGDAVGRGCDTLVTVGAPQSNHCRQTAAAAAISGMKAVLVLGGRGIREVQGNVLLDQVLGAEMRWAEDRETGMAEVVAELLAKGHSPYAIPLGGSNAIGAKGYYDAVFELDTQCHARDIPPFDRIVFATSSGGTQAGLAVGVKTLGWHTEVLGISVDEPALKLAPKIAEMAQELSRRIGEPRRWKPEDIVVNDHYISPGYAVLTTLEKEAITRWARMDGILLDPVYTGRAAGGLLELARWGFFKPGERILFWHTGGMPALFAYAKELV